MCMAGARQSVMGRRGGGLDYHSYKQFPKYIWNKNLNPVVQPVIECIPHLIAVLTIHAHTL